MALIGKGCVDAGAGVVIGPRREWLFHGSWRWIAAAAVSGVSLGFLNAVPDFPQYKADDAGFYLALGESLACGAGNTIYQLRE